MWQSGEGAAAAAEAAPRACHGSTQPPPCSSRREVRSPAARNCQLVHRTAPCHKTSQILAAYVCNKLGRSEVLRRAHPSSFALLHWDGVDSAWYFLTFKPECPAPPPLALTAQDCVPRIRRHIAGDTAQGGGAKPRLGFWVVGPMRGGGRGPVGVKCCAANSNLPPRRADPHAEGKPCGTKPPRGRQSSEWTPPSPASPVHLAPPPAPHIGDSRRTRTLGVRGGPPGGGSGALLG